jgi:hypothetical protein
MSEPVTHYAGQRIRLDLFVTQQPGETWNEFETRLFRVQERLRATIPAGGQYSLQREALALQPEPYTPDPTGAPA